MSCKADVTAIISASNCTGIKHNGTLKEKVHFYDKRVKIISFQIPICAPK